MVELVFRTDANQEIGTGHLNRCLMIADIMESKYGIGSAFLAARDSDDEPINMIRSKNYPVLQVVDPNFTSQLRTEFPETRLLVIDLEDQEYYKESFQKYVKDFGMGLMHITLDDSPFFHSDLVLNPNILALDQHYRCNPETRLLLGPEYFIYRDSFRDQQPQIKKVKPPYHALVCFGGADEKNLTRFATEVLLQSPLEIDPITIALGSLNLHYNTLQELQNKYSVINLHLHSKNMVDLISQCDFVVSSAGAIFWEATLLGRPSFVIATSEREKPALKYLDDHRFCVSLGTYDDLIQANLMIDLIERHTENQFKELNLTGLTDLINPKGIELVAEHMIQVIKHYR